MRPSDEEEEKPRGPSPWTPFFAAAVALAVGTGIARPLPPRERPDRLRFDPNTIPAPILSCLPLVGRSLTQRIEEARSIAPIRSESDLDRIKGVGPRMVRLLRPFLAYEADDPAVERAGVETGESP